MRHCMLCGKLSNGSVGAAGLKWSMICQPCKDIEDQALLDRISYQAKAMNIVKEGLCK